MGKPIDEEMAWEDYQGFSRFTRQLYECLKCGKTFMTREIYLSHECAKNKKSESAYDIKREKDI